MYQISHLHVLLHETNSFQCWSNQNVVKWNNFLLIFKIYFCHKILGNNFLLILKINFSSLDLIFLQQLLHMLCRLLRMIKDISVDDYDDDDDVYDDNDDDFMLTCHLWLSKHPLAAVQSNLSLLAVHQNAD